MKPPSFQKVFLAGAMAIMLLIVGAGDLLLRGAELQTARMTAARAALKVCIGLRVYSSDSGSNYPETLDVVVRSGDVPADCVYEKVSNWSSPRWFYIRLLDDSAAREYPVLIACQSHAPGRWIVAWNDSTVSEVNTAERTTLLIVQKKIQDAHGERHALSEDVIRIYNDAPKVRL